MKLVRLFWVKFHVEIFGTPLFQNVTPIFQMGLLFLKKEESRTPTFEIQVRTLHRQIPKVLCLINNAECSSISFFRNSFNCDRKCL